MDLIRSGIMGSRLAMCRWQRMVASVRYSLILPVLRVRISLGKTMVFMNEFLLLIVAEN